MASDQFQTEKENIVYTVCPLVLCPKRPVVAPNPDPNPVDAVLDVGVPNRLVPVF